LLPHIENRFGQVELVEPERLERSELFNRELAPVPVRDRKWNAFNYAALWIALAHSIPTYMLASALVGIGMSAFGAAATVLLGSTLLLGPLLLNAHAGARYGIAFAVFARAAYGVQGAHVATLIRAFLACGWFGIQTWIGGHALHVLLGSLFPAWLQFMHGQWIAFGAFWLINLFVAMHGLKALRRVENFAAPFVLVMTCALLLWAIGSVGFSELVFSTPLRAQSVQDVVPALTASIGFWATMAMSIGDYSRYARSQKEHVLGQALALPWGMALYAAMAAFITQATVVIYGDAVWDPVQLVSRFHSPLITCISTATVLLASLSVNIAANVVSPARAFSNAYPKRLSFRIGAWLTAALGVAVMPWKLLEMPEDFLFRWLLGSSVPTGAVLGVLIVDYWVLRKRALALGALYDPDGEYQGVKKSAVAATVIGLAVGWVGLVVPALASLYDVAFFSAFVSAGFAHWSFAKSRQPRK
jgi:nucleobase:cation symporter-1, NCS1 family